MNLSDGVDEDGVDEDGVDEDGVDEDGVDEDDVEEVVAVTDFDVHCAADNALSLAGFSLIRVKLIDHDASAEEADSVAVAGSFYMVELEAHNIEMYDLRIPPYKRALDLAYHDRPQLHLRVDTSTWTKPTLKHNAYASVELTDYEIARAIAALNGFGDSARCKRLLKLWNDGDLTEMKAEVSPRSIRTSWDAASTAVRTAAPDKYALVEYAMTLRNDVAAIFQDELADLDTPGWQVQRQEEEAGHGADADEEATKAAIIAAIRLEYPDDRSYEDGDEDEDEDG